jgi:hypothetical protein
VRPFTQRPNEGGLFCCLEKGWQFSDVARIVLKDEGGANAAELDSSRPTARANNDPVRFAHLDHTGGSAELKKETGDQLIVGERDKPLIEGGTIRDRRARPS